MDPAANNGHDAPYCQCISPYTALNIIMLATASAHWYAQQGDQWEMLVSSGTCYQKKKSQMHFPLISTVTWLYWPMSSWHCIMLDTHSNAAHSSVRCIDWYTASMGHYGCHMQPGSKERARSLLELFCKKANLHFKSNLAKILYCYTSVLQAG